MSNDETRCLSHKYAQGPGSSSADVVSIFREAVVVDLVDIKVRKVCRERMRKW